MDRILETLIINIVYPVVLCLGAWMIGITSFTEALKVAAAVFVGAALGETLIRVYGRLTSSPA